MSDHYWGNSEGVSIKPGGFFARRLEAHRHKLSRHKVSPYSVTYHPVYDANTGSFLFHIPLHTVGEETSPTP